MSLELSDIIAHGYVTGTVVDTKIAATQTANQDFLTAVQNTASAALIQAGVYATESAGRAAVTDGAAFKVQGSGDVAAYEYRRVNSSSSTLIATYPNTTFVQSVVKPSRSGFIQAGKNLVDKSTARIGYYLSNTNVEASSATYDYTDFIAVTAGQQYVSSHNMRFVCYFDSNRAYVAGGSSVDTTTFTVPVGVSFVRVTFPHTNINAFQLEQASSTTAYETFYYKLSIPSGPKVYAVDYFPLSIAGSNIAQSTLPFEKTNFIVTGKNLFDKNGATLGYYVSNTGFIDANATYGYTNYIAVTAGQQYSLNGSGSRFICFYDANLTVIAGGISTSGTKLFTAPVGAVYTRITFFVVDFDTLQIELGSSSTAFEAFYCTAKLPSGTAITAAPNTVTVDVVTPPYIFGVQGRECNLYFDNIFVGSESYLIDCSSTASTAGIQQNERWTWTPSGATSSGVLTIGTYSKESGTLLKSNAIEQRSASSTSGSGSVKKVLVIGDSLINAGVITQTLKDIAATDVMGVSLLGTRGTGDNKHEGRGGWTISNYTSNYTEPTYGANPFWISGAVNFPQYLTNNSVSTPDWVMIHLGINDVFSQTSDTAAIATATAAFNNLDTLITSIKSAGAGVKVGLMLPTPPSFNQDAFGASYGVGQSRWRFKRNILLWTKTLLARYSGQESNRVYVVPTSVSIDTVNNVSYAASAPVNSRASVNVSRANNGVHPADSGYQQLGDALWAFLKYYA